MAVTIHPTLWKERFQRANPQAARSPALDKVIMSHGCDSLSLWEGSRRSTWRWSSVDLLGTLEYRAILGGLLEGQRGPEPSRVAAHLHLGDPLDPVVPAIAWSDEPQGKSMLGGERLSPDVGGKQETIGLVQGKAARVSRGGPEQDAARAVLEFCLLEQGGYRHPAPALHGVPAAGTIAWPLGWRHRERGAPRRRGRSRAGPRRGSVAASGWDLCAGSGRSTSL